MSHDKAIKSGKPIKPRNGKVLPYDEWNFDAEAGDYMIRFDGTVYRLEENSSQPQRDAGELYPRKLKRTAVKTGDIWYWTKP